MKSYKHDQLMATVLQDSFDRAKLIVLECYAKENKPVYLKILKDLENDYAARKCVPQYFPYKRFIIERLFHYADANKTEEND